MHVNAAYVPSIALMSGILTFADGAAVLLPADGLDVVQLTSEQVASGRLLVCKQPLTSEQVLAFDRNPLTKRIKAILRKRQGSIMQVRWALQEHPSLNL
jgi:hypothetical protein